MSSNVLNHSQEKSQQNKKGDREYFLSIGLNSNMKQSDFKRKKLNLVIVLDISGSMNSSFQRYYYNDNSSTTVHNKKEKQSISEHDRKSKLRVATEAIDGLLDHLNSDDRFGMVLFDDESYTARPLNHLKPSDKQIIRNNIANIDSRGATNMEAGYDKATKLFDKLKHLQTADDTEYDNRIIVLTDDMPNVGKLSKNDFLQMTQSNANAKTTKSDGVGNIYSTFIGVGVDFNSEIVDHITKIRGANYYSVHDNTQFLKRMNDEFEHMVTPLVFDLEMKLESDSMSLEKVYGSNSDENNAVKDGRVMNIPTLFPSGKDDQTQETKGGIILAKLKEKLDSEMKQDSSVTARLIVSYKDDQENVTTSEEIVDFAKILKCKDNDVSNGEFASYDNNGIRKGILLSRYVNLLHEWIDSVNSCKHGTVHGDDDPNDSWNYDWEKYRYKGGKKPKRIISPAAAPKKSPWERACKSIAVSDEYKKKFSDFQEHFKKEMKTISDDTLQQEVDILDYLVTSANTK